MNQYIGITGITSQADAQAISRMLTDLDPTGTRLGANKIMMGALVSKKSMTGLKGSHWRRYPEPNEIASCFLNDPRFTNTLHICPGDGPNISDIIKDAMAFVGDYCDAFQINSTWPSQEVIRTVWVEGNYSASQMDMILQIGPKALQEAAEDGIVNKLTEYIWKTPQGKSMSFLDAVLIDASGGQGRGLDLDEVKSTIKHIRLLFEPIEPSIRIGIAGGLDATALEMPEIIAHVQDQISIDAEGRLRDDADGGGNLDMGKVYRYLDVALKVLPKEVRDPFTRDVDK